MHCPNRMDIPYHSAGTVNPQSTRIEPTITEWNEQQVQRKRTHLSSSEFAEARRPAPAVSKCWPKARELASHGMRVDKSRKVEMKARMRYVSTARGSRSPMGSTSKDETGVGGVETDGDLGSVPFLLDVLGGKRRACRMPTNAKRRDKIVR